MFIDVGKCNSSRDEQENIPEVMSGEEFITCSCTQANTDRLQIIDSSQATKTKYPKFHKSKLQCKFFDNFN